MQASSTTAHWKLLANSCLLKDPCVFGFVRMNGCFHRSYDECAVTGGHAAIALYFAQRICATQWLETLMPLTTLRSVRTHALMRGFKLALPNARRSTTTAVANGVALAHHLIDPLITIAEYDLLADLFLFVTDASEHERLLKATHSLLNMYKPKSSFLKNLHAEVLIGTFTTTEMIEAIELFVDNHYAITQAADMPPA